VASRAWCLQAAAMAGRRESPSRAALIEDDDKAGTVFRSDHWIRHPHDLGTVPAPHPGERTRHPVINKPSRHYAGTLGSSVAGKPGQIGHIKNDPES
jgi:hypothetical protein